MTTRRSRRTAAAAAVTKIANVVEDDSEDSTGSNFDNSGAPSRSSSEDGGESSGQASDNEYVKPSSKSKKTSKKNEKSKAKITSPPAPKAPVVATVAMTPPPSVSEDNNENRKELTNDSLKSLLRGFRLTDLQALFVYVNKNKAGRKTELLERACDLVDNTTGEVKSRVSEKIQELSNAMYRSISSAPSVNPYSANYRTNQNSVAATPTYHPNTSTSSINVTDNNQSTQSSSTTRQPSSDKVTSMPPLNPYPSYPSTPYYSTQNSHLMYPTCPDVKLQSLPFYNIEGVLLKPSSLQPKGLARFQEQTFSFHLTPQQASSIASSSYRDNSGRQDFKRQIQLRFSLLETSCEQDDNFPASVCVKVNGRLQTLPNPIPTNKPGVEPKRPPKPINITGLCKLSSTVPNYVNVTWAVEVGSGYTVSVYFVDRLSSSDLMDKLKKKGKRNSDYTRALIKDKLSDKDNEIATTSCKVSLACPLGKMRMTTPCRSSTCDHLQCFDAKLYLMMNEKKPKWTCPVCNKPALFENLMVDGYFSEILASDKLPVDEHEIVLNSDASWVPLVPVKKSEDGKPKTEKPESPPPSPIMQNKKNVETLSLSDDEDDSLPPLPGAAPAAVAPAKPKSKEVDYVTLDSEDEEEEIRPPQSKKRKTWNESDDNSDSVISAAETPSATPPLPGKSSPAKSASTSANFIPMRNGGGSKSPEIICLDDD